MTITDIQELAKRYTEYDMIRLHTDLPDFPELRIRLLTACLPAATVSPEKSDLYALVTALIQMGLDTHERVSADNTDKGKPAARSRQLKVLAGVYFSARYYQLLAKAGEVDLIRQIAASVSEINRRKMNLYMAMKQMKLKAEDYIRDQAAIHSRLFLPFASKMEPPTAAVWPGLVQSLAACEQLTHELYSLSDQEAFAGSWAFWHILDHGTKEDRHYLLNRSPDPHKHKSLIHKYTIYAQLKQLLTEESAQFAQNIRLLNSERLRKELMPLYEWINRALPKSKTLEEI